MESIIINFQLLVDKRSSDIRRRLFFDVCIDELDHSDLEQRLRQLNFGYRARYIQEAVHFLKSTTDETSFFDRLKSLSTKEARIQLSRIMGVGRKVTFDRISSLSQLFLRLLIVYF